MEMGRRDMRRGEGTNRLSKKKSGSEYSTKSKKRMLKKVEEDEKLNHKKREMMMMCYDFPASDLENEDVSLKKKKKSSKFLKKNLKQSSNGCGVHPHASVPRKLRSAMKKRRNLESVSNLSSPSKRLSRSKTETESLNTDLVKDNQDAKDIVSKSMMISKDEEEVAETLFGLADMFTEASSLDNKTCDPPLLSDDDKETAKDDSILVVETDFTTKDESLEPVVSVLSSAKPKQLDEMPLQQDHNQRNLTGMVDFRDKVKQSSSMNVTNAPTRAIETKAATSDFEYKSNGDLALWPGLSSTVQSSSHVLSKPSSTKLPPWMGQAVSHTKNASPFSVRPRKFKKCATHIYICHLIKALQTSKSNQAEQRPSEVSQCRLPDPSDFKTKVAPSIRYQNQHLIDLHKTYSPTPVEEDKTQLSLELYGPHTTQKQSYDFLSLSSTREAQSHSPFPNSFPQYPISAAYNSQLSPAISSHHQMQQMSPYLASRFQTAYNANQQQQQQLQKRMWAAQYRPLTSGNPMPNQYIKPNLSLNLASIQPLQVASSPRYNNNVSQQQHRLMSAAAAMSMSHHHNNNRSRTVMNRQEHHFPLIYEDTRTPLQLLCNEQYG
ncbi:unnamed protein product [Eruca vesicaria subsp. sativa]|uniref:Uncharacterized protein n=1 Tax=Eruca vesicaria subsp. sativa TaxID=29727 RepID=A0ABC8IX42_ERUVS|nr:unnamed protein product [Eruca vesicaria subsp. sativa]